MALFILIIIPSVHAEFCENYNGARIKIKLEAYESIYGASLNEDSFQVLKRRYQIPYGREDSNLFLKGLSLVNQNEDCDLAPLDIDISINGIPDYKIGRIQLPSLKPNTSYYLGMVEKGQAVHWPQILYQDSYNKKIKLSIIPIRESGIFEIVVNDQEKNNVSFLLVAESPDGRGIYVDHKIKVWPYFNAKTLDLMEEIDYRSRGLTTKTTKGMIVINLLGIIVALFIALCSIYYMRKTSNEQIEKMDETCNKQISITKQATKEQIVSQEKRQAEKQKAILEGLEQQISIIGDNHKKLQELKTNYPADELDKAYLILSDYYINEIDAKYYATNLSNSINGKITKRLKLLLFRLNDKIKQINNGIRAIEGCTLHEKIDSTTVWLKLDDLLNFKPESPYSDLKRIINDVKKELKKLLK